MVGKIEFQIVLLLLVATVFGIVSHPGSTVERKPPNDCIVRLKYGSGVVIGKNTFITAGHVELHDTVDVCGSSYTVDGYVEHEDLDLKIVHVVEEFDSYVNLYSGTVGKGVEVVIGGYGKTRGNKIESGYDWTGPRKLTWASNNISLAYDRGYHVKFRHPSEYPDDGVLAMFDSGCGMFVECGGVWYLVGVAKGVSELDKSCYGDTPSKSYFVNLDSAVNWICKNNPTSADINGDGVVDMVDFAILSEHWLE